MGQHAVRRSSNANMQTLVTAPLKNIPHVHAVALFVSGAFICSCALIHSNVDVHVHIWSRSAKRRTDGQTGRTGERPPITNNPSKEISSSRDLASNRVSSSTNVLANRLQFTIQRILSISMCKGDLEGSSGATVAG